MQMPPPPQPEAYDLPAAGDAARAVSGCWEPSSGPQKAQCVLLAAEPPPRPYLWVSETRSHNVARGQPQNYSNSLAATSPRARIMGVSYHAA